jgi:hypothetical protein
MAGIKYQSMRDIGLPSASERYQKRGLWGVISGATPEEKAIASALQQFREGNQTTVNAGPLESGYVPLAQGQTEGAPPGDVNELMKNLIGSGPEGIAQAQKIASMLGMNKGQGSQGSKVYGQINYFTDEKGNLHPYVLTKEGGIQELQLPAGAAAAVPSSTTQTTGGDITQIPRVGSPGRRPITTKTGLQAPATAAEAKQTATQEMSIGMADKMRNLVKSGQVNVGPVEGRLLSLRGKTGANLSEQDAELLSLEENYSNQLLHALRGAQVGPKEQEMFNKSLPRINQPKALFLKNIDITERNIRKLNERQSKMRPVPRLKNKAGNLQQLKNKYGLD